MGFEAYRQAAGSVGQSQVQNGYVDLSTAQTVGGVKTFSSQVVVPSSAGLRFAGDADSDLNWDATKGIYFRIDGSERLRVTVGNTLQVVSPVGAAAAILNLSNTAGGFSVFAGSGTPEGVVSAGFGAEYTDLATGRFYSKRTTSGNTGWVQIDRCESGTYTPTGTAVSNVDSVTPSPSHFVRVGNTVVQSGRLGIDATAAGVASVRLSLSVASAFSASNEATGTVTGIALNASGNRVEAETTNDQLLITVDTTSTANQVVWYSCAYTVV